MQFLLTQLCEERKNYKDQEEHCKDKESLYWDRKKKDKLREAQP